MNTLFLVAYTLLLLLNLFFNWNRMRAQHKSLKRLSMTVYAVSAGVFVCLLLRIEIPMPTRFFINHVSPWVLSFIHP